MFERFFSSKPFLVVEPLPEPVTEPAPVPEAEPYIRPVDPTEKGLNMRRAEALLHDPVLNAAFEHVANIYRQQWEHATRGEVELQQTAHLSLAALKDVRSRIIKFISDGKLWEAKLKHQ